MNEQKLKPCPFCEDSASLYHNHEDDGYDPFSAVACDGCGARTLRFDVEPTPDDRDRRAATEWNHRPIEDALTAERDELKAENGILQEIDHHFSCLLDRLTGGKMSKTNYELSVMETVIEDYFNETLDQDIKDIKEEDAHKRQMITELTAERDELRRQVGELRYALKQIETLHGCGGQEFIRIAQDIAHTALTPAGKEE